MLCLCTRACVAVCMGVRVCVHAFCFVGTCVCALERACPRVRARMCRCMLRITCVHAGVHGCISGSCLQPQLVYMHMRVSAAPGKLTHGSIQVAYIQWQAKRDPCWCEAVVQPPTGKRPEGLAPRRSESVECQEQWSILDHIVDYLLCVLRCIQGGMKPTPPTLT